VIVYFKCKRPTKEQWQAAVAKAATRQRAAEPDKIVVS
jgi:hypothetical protein